MEYKLVWTDELLNDPLVDKETQLIRRKFYVERFFEKDTAIQLTRLRKSAGLTQQELAERLGTSQAHISRCESGEHSPSLKTIVDIASELGFRVELTFTKINLG